MQLILTTTFLLALASGLFAVEKPGGKFLFQPMLIWGTSEVTHQGTGYLMKYNTKTFGVTSIHFLDFEAGGLFEAIWLDIHTSKPVVGFRTSAGKPKVTSIEEEEDIKNDFLLMPIGELPNDSSSIEIEKVAKYQKGHKLWFPNKSQEEGVGYKWVEAEVVEDKGYMISIKFLSKVQLQSQSGSPFFSQETGRAIGMLMGGTEDEIYLCPTRGIAAALEADPKPVLLIKSITKEG